MPLQTREDRRRSASQVRRLPGRSGSPKSSKITNFHYESLLCLALPGRRAPWTHLSVVTCGHRFLMDFGSYARVVAPERLANAMQPRGDHLRSVSQCCGAHPAGLEVQNHQKSLEITDFHYGPLLCLAGRRAPWRHFPRPGLDFWWISRATRG